MDELVRQHGGDERTVIARRYLDSAEAWLRRLLHEELVQIIGPEYITAGEWNEGIKNRVKKEVQKEPEEFTRQVDATVLAHLIDMTCDPNHWPKWADALSSAYPDGPDEARTFLGRLKHIRNDVQHGRVCTGRQLEQAICYSNDLIDSIKDHFRRNGLGREFNVPTFIRAYDNLGNNEHLAPGHHFRTSNFSAGSKGTLHPGETLIAEVEVDPTFDPSGYTVMWWLKTGTERGHGAKAVIPLTNAHVRERIELQFQLRTHRDWHRTGTYDDVLDLFYKVLPPPDAAI